LNKYQTGELKLGRFGLVVAAEVDAEAIKRVIIES